MSTATLRGPSVDAAAELADQLGTPSGAAAAKIAEGLFGLVAIVRSEGRLRRAITDASTSPQARSTLVKDVFGGQVDSSALDLAAQGAQLKWTSTRDYADTLEELGVQASVRSQSDAGVVADELFAVGRLLSHNPPLRDALADPSRSVSDKQSLLAELIGSQVSEATSALVTQAFAGTHHTVMQALAAFQKTAAAVQGEGIATVRSARVLSEAETNRLAEALTQQYGRPVHLNAIIDPDLVGGLRVEIGNDVIDGSVSARLDEARRRLAG